MSIYGQEQSMTVRMLPRQISLPLLKNQIDKSILKITWMVNSLQTSKRINKKNCKNLKWESKYIQTENSIMNCEKQQPPLAEINWQNLTNIKKETQTLKYFKAQNKKRLTGNKRQDENSKKYLSDLSVHSKRKPLIHQEDNQVGYELIESNGFTFRQLNNNEAGSTDRKNIQDSQDDRIFESINFGVQINDVESCLSQTNLSFISSNNYRTTIQRNKTQNLQNLIVGSFSQLKNQKSTKRNKRSKVTDKQVSIHESQKRIIVTESCKQKMKLIIQEIKAKKRKQITDNNLRVNVLKKIEERYNQ